MGATSGAGTAYPSWAPELTPGVSGVRVTWSLVLCVCLSFFFWPLCCLFFFDWLILITHLISSFVLISLCKIVRSSVILLLPLFALFNGITIIHMRTSVPRRLNLLWIMFNISASYSNAVHLVIWEGWWFTDMWKTLTWPN